MVSLIAKYETLRGSGHFLKLVSVQMEIGMTAMFSTRHASQPRAILIFSVPNISDSLNIPSPSLPDQSKAEFPFFFFLSLLVLALGR